MAGNNFNARSMGHDVSDQPRLGNGQFTFKGSPTAATIPLHRQQAALEAPMPVSQNAPLEERMYPARVADVVKKHAQGDHSTLQPYSPEPNAAVLYYRMGVSELAIPNGTERYGQRIPSTDLHYDHMHFVGSEGSNFGLSLGGVFSESLPDLNNYQVEAPKYRKEYIDRAKTDIDNAWKERKILERFSQEYNPFIYKITTYNCQHYFAEVLQQAQKYETREKPLVLP
ncbi:hypothetical protein JMF94_00215 [Desulfovibrio sp. UIB00]|uniref:hypothetical protein n=1 Tax=Desulfovibrio sp. UIB00 TaxID=2804314 RepID=UPI001F0E1EF3|nr:hypothetical protein [Desulfovibrio sp. UIB00]MCH5143504.1 hypothetical protein [Desulfovibrio sp. UIB00]